jgi:hypothetical protein
LVETVLANMMNVSCNYNVIEHFKSLININNLKTIIIDFANIFYILLSQFKDKDIVLNRIFRYIQFVINNKFTTTMVILVFKPIGNKNSPINVDKSDLSNYIIKYNLQTELNIKLYMIDYELKSKFHSSSYDDLFFWIIGVAFFLIYYKEYCNSPTNVVNNKLQNIIFLTNDKQTIQLPNNSHIKDDANYVIEQIGKANESEYPFGFHMINKGIQKFNIDFFYSENSENISIFNYNMNILDNQNLNSSNNIKNLFPALTDLNNLDVFDWYYDSNTNKINFIKNNSNLHQLLRTFYQIMMPYGNNTDMFNPSNLSVNQIVNYIFCGKNLYNIYRDEKNIHLNNNTPGYTPFENVYFYLHCNSNNNIFYNNFIIGQLPNIPQGPFIFYSFIKIIQHLKYGDINGSISQSEIFSMFN